MVRALFNDALDDECVTTNPFANLRLDQRRGRRDLVRAQRDRGPRPCRRSLACSALTARPSARAFCSPHMLDCDPPRCSSCNGPTLISLDSQVRINRSLGNTGEITLPKNGRSGRVVLPPQAKEVLLAMPRRADSPYVFTTPPRSGGSPRPRTITTGGCSVRGKRPEMAFYELRHFCATHLLELGVSHADVAVQLGHTDGGALVMSTYGHPSDEAARARVLAAYRATPHGV